MVPDVDEWDERWEREAHAQARAAEDLAGRVAALEATASDAARVVTVTVDSAGVPTSLTLARTAASRTPNDLARLIMATMRAAQAKLASAVAEATKAIPDLDEDSAAEIRASYAARFPEAREEKPRW